MKQISDGLSQLRVIEVQGKDDSIARSQRYQEINQLLAKQNTKFLNLKQEYEVAIK
jgi:hypothetical protein